MNRYDKKGQNKKPKSTGFWVLIIVIIVVVIIIISIVVWLLFLRGDSSSEPVQCTAAPPAPTNLSLQKTTTGNTVHTITWDNIPGSQGLDSTLVRHWYNNNCSGSVSDTQTKPAGTTVAVFSFAPNTSIGDHCYRLETRNSCGLSGLVPPQEPFLTSTVP